MNIDEAINQANTLLKAMRNASERNLNNILFEAVTTRNDIKAIETIINEYNNLKQVEETHKIENGELRTKINELEREITGLKQTFTIHDDIDNHIPRID